MMMRKKMSKNSAISSTLQDDLKKIKENVLRALGKYQDIILVIKDRSTFDNYISACISTGYISIDTETNNSLDPLTCKLMGLCLYAPGLRQAYIPVNHRDPSTKIRLSNQLTEQDIKEELQRVLEANLKVIMHNAKFDYEVLKCTCDISIEPFWDTMIAARLLNDNDKKSGLKEQYRANIDPTQEEYSIEKLFKKVQYADVDPEIFALYSAHDAYMTYKLFEYQVPLMKSETRLFKLFQDIEMPLICIVAEMELCGVLADLSYCQKLKEKYGTKLTEIDNSLNNEIVKIKHIIDEWRAVSGSEREIIFPPANADKLMSKEELEKNYPLYNATKDIRYKHGKPYVSLLSTPIKLSSPKQLSILLYKILEAPTVNEAKPYATGHHEIEKILQEVATRLNQFVLDPEANYLEPEEIEKLESLKTICDLLGQRRKVEKLITTYLNPIPELAKHWEDGKVRFQLKQLGADTGRFSSGGKWSFYENDVYTVISGMNAQNIPSETQEIRLIFKAEPGRTFVGGDISQQEPKITAHISQDDNMIQVFEEGKDIYASIAQVIKNNNYEDNLEFFDKEKTQTNSEGKKNRKIGKIIILASMYGMGVPSIALMLNNKNLAEVQNMLDAFYGKFPGVKAAQDNSISYCKKHGFVEDTYGRKRHLPNIQLPLYQVQFTDTAIKRDKTAEELLYAYLNSKEHISENELEDLRQQAAQYNLKIISNEEAIKRAERQCFNARIQGSAATLTKMIMILVDRNLKLKELGARIIFQIHDELIVDCPIENAEAVSEELKATMERSSGFVNVSLPMKCDMTIESRWGENLMATELKDYYKKLQEKNIENPLEELCKEFPNFPEESIRQIICGNSKVLKF